MIKHIPIPNITQQLHCFYRGDIVDETLLPTDYHHLINELRALQVDIIFDELTEHQLNEHCTNIKQLLQEVQHTQDIIETRYENVSKYKDKYYNHRYEDQLRAFKNYDVKTSPGNKL